MYIGMTERGRRVVEETLIQAVESLAFVAGKTFIECVTVSHRTAEPRKWYVYDSQARADLDAAKGDDDRIAWFAIVEEDDKR
jgi:hypothetical protein